MIMLDFQSIMLVPYNPYMPVACWKETFHCVHVHHTRTQTCVFPLVSNAGFSKGKRKEMLI